jgi:hypothetical protein
MASNGKSAWRIPEAYRSQLSPHTVRTLEQWVNYAGDLPDFCYYLLSGQAPRAARIADDTNQATFWLLNALIAEWFPDDCYGSKEAVRDWKGLVEARQEEEEA